MDYNSDIAIQIVHQKMKIVNIEIGKYQKLFCGVSIRK